MPTWDEPASACLSSRIPYHSEVTDEKLRTIERAEQALRTLGFRVCRVRHHDELARVEIYLVSRSAQVVAIDGEVIELAKGEAIHTEYSHKYTVERFAAMAAGAGLVLRRQWTDKKGYFAVLHFAVGA